MAFVPNCSIESLSCAHGTLRTLLSECVIKKTDAARRPAPQRRMTVLQESYYSEEDPGDKYLLMSAVL